MALANVTLQYQYFADPNKGRPIALGSVFVGIVGTDPETPSNQLTIIAKQEDGTEVPLSQPVSLSAGGVPQLNGSPIRILVDGAHSLKVLDSGLNQVYYLNDSIEGTEITPFGESLISAEDADAGRVIMNSMEKVSSAVTDNLMTFDADDEAQDSGIGIARVVQITDDSGTADLLIADFTPAIAALTDGLEVRVRALFSNATTTPTIDYNSLGAKTIVKNGNQALSIDDIAGPDHELILVYNSGNDNVELLNPAGSSEAIQTWQDVTGSRSLGVNYTNTTGAPIEIAVHSQVLSGIFNFRLIATVAGVAVTIGSGDAPNNLTDAAGSITIPDGAVYQLTTSTASTLQSWAELR